MKAKLLMICLSLFAIPAMANLEIGAIAQSSRIWFDGPENVSYGKSENLKTGALLLLALFPGISLRTGAVYHNRKFDVNSAGTTTEVTDQMMEVPINLQVGLPVTDLYVFGGMTMAMPQSTKCSTEVGACEIGKSKNDNMTNLGLGYDVFSFALFRLALEAEYQMGSSDISAGDGTLKQSSFNLGAGFFFGF